MSATTEASAEWVRGDLTRTGPIEPHYGKCLDYNLPQPLEHYRALIKTLGRLAGSHWLMNVPAFLQARIPELAAVCRLIVRT